MKPQRFAMVLLWACWACYCNPAVADPPGVDFERDIRPILFGRCAKCHAGHEPEAGLSLTARATATAKLDSGATAIVPGKPQSSELLARITATDPDLRMPPKGAALTSKQIHDLQAWISAGAHWPEHWAYRPLAKPSIPSVSQSWASWVNNPIDAFVIARLQSQGLRPTRPARKRDWLRRVYFDLIGLPPTAEEVDAFEADDKPGAYDRVVDRLLASPHYGERWARHWMDLVHFAESHGHDQDRPREHAWPYRDYLIAAFNQDKPYARFVQEQIAGDVLFPNDPAAIVATGLLAAGPWDESSLRDIQPDSIDRLIGQYLDRDDIVASTISTFASTTVHCARCHDHKFDPITQAEYYALQSVFAGIDKAERTYDPDPKVARKRALLTGNIERARAGTLPADILHAPKLAVEVAAWEQKQADSAWRPLEIIAVQSEQGATLTRLDDGSVLSGGQRPDKDVYTVRVRLGEHPLAALRIDVQPDSSLPQSGPGREENGNLHLNEVQAALIDRQGHERALAWASARADFEQSGWPAAAAIDGKDATAWAIYPQVGRAHWAVFNLREAIAPSPEHATLVIRLKQVQGAGRLIGRFQLRFSPTASTDSDPLPPAIREILALPRERRNEQQRAALASHYLLHHWQRELGELPPPEKVYCGTNHFEAQKSFAPAQQPRAVFVLKRGNVQAPGAAAVPGGLSCIGELPATFELSDSADEGARRAALARWLSSTKNVLTWRSIVNRVWQHHFGHGIVDTPNDFGRMGAAPTHPELLDWLAVTLQERGGSIKSLHRLIVTSATYRQAADYNSPQSQVDAGNQYLWRMNRRRLDAESIRDALRLLSGRLDRTMGGPSVRNFIQTPGDHVTPRVDYLSADLNAPGMMRRSVYRFLFRTLPDPFMSSMDCPEGSQLTPQRTESLTAAQALALANDGLVIRLCEHLATAIEADTTDVEAQVRALYRRVLARQPDREEAAAMGAYVEAHGLANACRVLVNSNEFIFVD